MHDLNRIKSEILSILYVASKPVSLKELVESLEIDSEKIQDALTLLAKENENSGIIILNVKDKYQLSSNPDNSSAVRKFLSLELREKLSDATLETLAIIVYRNPISKADIENIRGVNSQYTLRQLMIRGLVEKVPSTTDRRSQLYEPTHELLQHLGIKSMQDLPDFEELTKNIQLNTVAPSEQT